MRYDEIFLESFNQPYDYTWVERDHRWWFGNFKTENDDLVELIILDRQPGQPDDTWNITFNRNKNVGVSGKGNAFQIYATIIVMVKEFIKTKNPARIVFSASKERGTSRAVLYNQMLKRFANQIGYSFEQSPGGDMFGLPSTVEFVLTFDKQK